MNHSSHGHEGAIMLEAAFGQLQAFAELGWMGVILAVILVAWKPTLSYLGTANRRRIEHAEHVIEVMQKEMQRMEEKIDKLELEVEKWRGLYFDVQKCAVQQLEPPRH